MAGLLLLLALVVPAEAQIPGPLKLAVPSQPAATEPAAPLAQQQATTVQPIPLPQVADRAEELDQKLEQISRTLAARKGAPLSDQALATQAPEIQRRAAQVDSFLENSPDILPLRDEVVYWQALYHQSFEERKLLTGRAAELQTQIRMLDEDQLTWQATRDQIHDTAGIEVVAARVQQELDSIRDTRSQAQEQLNQILNLQNQLSQTGRQISDSLAKLTDAESKFRNRVFDRDSKPLWARGALHTADQPMTVMLRRSAGQDASSAGEFLQAGALGLFTIPFAYMFGLFGATRLKRYLATHATPEIPSKAHEVLGRSYSMALLVALIVSIPLTSSAPTSVSLAIYLLWMGLVFRLAPLLIEKEIKRFVYPLLALNLVEFARVGIPLYPGLNRVLLTAILLAALLTFSWLGWRARQHVLQLARWPHLAFKIGLRAGISLLAAAVIANVCGYVSLSHVLGVGTLISAFLAVGLYCVTHVIVLALIVYLHSPWATPLSIDLRQSIERWGRIGLLAIAAVLWWTRSELYTFMIHDAFENTVSSVLGYPLHLGKTQFTIGSILTVLLILIIGYGLAKFSSSLLRSILLARFPLRRGLPYAISKVTYYCLMLLVFTAAIASAGVELNKFTVITGALGVGVGFGLQNIVNNFASGLILLFERPIRVDDTVEVNGLVGTVKRIGARSSTITTAQGAEVIVPNSNLLSNQVVNWTLSSPWRRVDIPVGVGYDSDPEAVLNLLAGVAAAHPNVMPEPAPVAYFLGFGDSALNFELRFWSARQDTWFQLKSDVTTAVARALREANIEIPFPQRDLHVRSVDGSIPDVFAGRQSDNAANVISASPHPSTNVPSVSQTESSYGSHTSER